VTGLRKFELDARGLAYVRAHLTFVNTLCTALLATVEAEPGTVFTVAPADAGLERLHAFETGGLLRANLDFSRAVSAPGGGSLMAVDTLVEVRAERIARLLTTHPGAVCIVDDYNLRWGDELFGAERTAFGVGEEVYHLLDGTEAPDRIADVLADADTLWHGVAAVCRPSRRVTREDLSSAEALQACARTVVEITCTSYDGEGFVGWRRAPSR
jgi:hypothetical protein